MVALARFENPGSYHSGGAQRIRRRVIQHLRSFPMETVQLVPDPK
jgi:hypothetical protein